MDSNIQFTYEEENNNTLPFLDVNIHRTNDNFLFSVYRKPTYKNDIIHFLSHHNKTIKTGVIIGFFLRALRICSPQYLQDELTHIENCFTSLKYPLSFINKSKRKAFSIMSNPQRQSTEEKRRIILPTNCTIENTKQNLSDTYQIITQTSKTIKNLVQHTKQSHEHIGSIYKIPCLNCDKVYIGETGRDIKKRIQEHKQALRRDDTLNALVQHRNKCNHQINIENTTIIHKENNKTRRKLLEAAAISQTNTIEQRPGFVNIAPTLARKLIITYKIGNTGPPT